MQSYLNDKYIKIMKSAKKESPDISELSLLFHFLNLGFDSLVIVSIGAGIALADDLAFLHLADKQHVAAQILLMEDLTAEHGAGAAGDIGDAVVRALKILEVCELVNIPAGLHTEVTDHVKRNRLRQHTDVKLSGFFNDFSRFVAHLYGDGQLGGLIAHLHAGVGDEAVILVILGGNDKQTVR